MDNIAPILTALAGLIAAARMFFKEKALASKVAYDLNKCKEEREALREEVLQLALKVKRIERRRRR